MGSLSSLLLAYLLGGLTFLPLVFLLILAHAHHTQPVVDPAAERRKRDELLQEPAESRASLASLPLELQKPDRERDAAAGYFAISREYVPGGVNGKPPERLTPAGEVIAVESPSVYQSMYRSIFERNKAQGPSFETSNGGPKAVKKARNVFYVVLRLGHLMLYDNIEQLEVRHVISLGLYDVDIFGGGDEVPEGELWVKRNCIRLRRRDLDGLSQDSKPYYLFSDNCSEKEDLFHALILNQHRSSTNPRAAVQPLQFQPEHMIKLVQQLHGSEELMQVRWLNALLGRLFLSMYKTTEVQSFIHAKITKKLTRVPKPSFIEDISVGKIDMGTAAPLFTNPKLRELTLDGELIIECDVKYSGNFRLEIAATVLIDLGKRFNVRRIDVLLAGICKSLEGHLLVKVKPPPCNRLWISFETMPKLDLSIEPIVSSRQITYGIILRTIESKIREVIGETLVIPNWDDIPFSHSEGHSIRGGLWETDAHDYKPAEETELVIKDAEDIIAPAGFTVETPLKSQSTSSLVRRRPVGIAAGDALKAAKQATEALSISSSREGSTTRSKPKAMRSSSFASASPPVVSMSPTNASAVRDESHASLQDAASTMKGISSRSSSTSSTPAPDGHGLGVSLEDDEVEDRKVSGEHDLFDLEMPVEDSPRLSSDTTSTTMDSPRPKINVEGFGTPHYEDINGKRKGLVSGAQNATAAARKWGYDFVTKRAMQTSSNDSTSDTASVQSMPIGRGQPLPPPGQPLPGPPNTFRKSWTSALGNMGSITRKKVPPTSPSITSLSSEGRGAALAAAREVAEPVPPLPPRRSLETMGKNQPSSSPGHARRASTQSRRSSTRAQRTASMDDHGSDEVLVIKAPDAGLDGEAGREEDEGKPKPLVVDRVAERGELQASGSEESSLKQGTTPPEREEESEGSDLTDSIVTEKGSRQLGLGGGSDETRKADRDSLEMLQTLVH